MSAATKFAASTVILTHAPLPLALALLFYLRVSAVHPGTGCSSAGSLAGGDRPLINNVANVIAVRTLWAQLGQL